MGETSKDSEMIRLDGTSQAVNHVGSEEFELQYTCKVCETRNIYKISRMGEYRIIQHDTLQLIFFDLVPLFTFLAIFFTIVPAYRNGVVITDCKGCESKHMIADNLGWI